MRTGAGDEYLAEGMSNLTKFERGYLAAIVTLLILTVGFDVWLVWLIWL